MIPALHRTRLDRHARAWLVAQLQMGPWLWPADGIELDRALALVPSGPPPARAGQVLLLTVSPTTTSLWVLHGAREPAWPAAALGPVAHRLWTTACSVLPRSVPVLWRSLQRLEALPLEAAWLSSLTQEGAIELGENVIDGSSFGLALLLSMASLLFERSLPGDLAASAQLEADGRLGPVDGLGAKLEVLTSHAPGVRRLLVASSQVQEASSAARSGVQIVGVSSAAEALDAVFGSELSLLLLQAGSDPEHRRAWVESFFGLALAGRAAAVDWRPVAEAARIALESWPELEPFDRDALQLARMVASRHEATRAPVVAPGEAFLAALAAPVRVEVVAHTVQQAADLANPEPQEAWALGHRHLVRGQEAFVPHLKLLGALARLASVTGRPDDALLMQQEAADGLLERRAWAEVSYPLAECFRLSGVLGDPEAFSRAERALSRWMRTAGPEARGMHYVTLGRCRALVMLARGEEAVGPLRTLRQDPALPAHVQGAATRWLIRCANGAERQALIQSIARAARDAPELAGRCADLVELDAAILSGAAAQPVLERLRAREPGLLRNLLSAPDADAAYVALMHPY